ncbi:MAG: hypothetical protein LQ344_006539 [Seirophora lacunosa]|nr:MAG: hypothetical protein LQ344_006539 [Seirophora lacunosa]
MSTPSNSDSDLSPVEDLESPETTASGQSRPKTNEELTAEHHGQGVSSKYCLRPRKVTEESIYRAPWQNERKRKREQSQGKNDQIEKIDHTQNEKRRRQHSTAENVQITKIIDDDNETEDEGESGTATPEKIAASVPRAAAPASSSQQPAHGILLLLKAAALLGHNETPCTSPACPIFESHGSGLYRHPEPVPDSALANAYFAPSIPPPIVVAAFNAAAQDKPSLADLHTKDVFFAEHTAPCRPSKHLDKTWKLQCRSERCGVAQGGVLPHKKGVYLHLGLDASPHLAAKVGWCFGVSNPPPEVWEAALRCKDGVDMEGDQELVDDFSAHHVRFAHGHSGVDAFTEWQKERMRERP